MQGTIELAKADRVATFRHLLDELCAMAGRENLKIVPYEGDGPKWFPLLGEKEQIATLCNLHRYIRAAQDVISDGDTLATDRAFIWRMFQSLGVRPVSNLMDHIQQGDVVEIYNAEFVQVFRSLSFFAICSYTLDDVLCRPFWELYRRDEKLTQELVTVAQRDVLTATKPGIIDWTTAPHAVDEIDSLARYHSVVQMKMISPLFDSTGRVAAFVNTFRVISCERTAPEITHLSNGGLVNNEVRR